MKFSFTFVFLEIGKEWGTSRSFGAAGGFGKLVSTFFPALSRERSTVKEPLTDCASFATVNWLLEIFPVSAKAFTTLLPNRNLEAHQNGQGAAEWRRGTQHIF